MIAYFDSSALIKFFAPDEAGRELAETLWDGAERHISSAITVPETRAALAGMLRTERLAGRPATDARRLLVSLVSVVSLLDATTSLCRVAAEVADAFELRGADAIHLASALPFRRSEHVFVTWDDRLAEAARAAGLATAGA